jgi:hypothetical protein
MAKEPDKVLDPVAYGSLYLRAEPEVAEDIVRIDLDVTGSGEISAAISLVRTVCPVLYMGMYSREHAERQVIYVRVGASGAQQVADALRHYGFKVMAIRQECDSPQKRVFSARN